LALEILWLVIAIVGSFLSGSIPYSVIIGRLSTGRDLREYNIGNPGGFNAVMTYGLTIGMIVIFVDIMKGFVPIALIDWAFANHIGTDTIYYKLAVILGPIFCILGHNHSPFLKFRGGRGTAVFIGTLFWVNPLTLIVFFIPFGLMIGLLKIPTRVSSFISGIFFIPASLFISIAPPWGYNLLTEWILPPSGQYLFMIPFFICFGMWLAWLPRLIPSLIDAIKGKEWTLKIGEGQQFSEKFDTKKELVTEEVSEETKEESA